MPKFTELSLEKTLGSGVSRTGWLTSNPKLVMKVAHSYGTDERLKSYKKANLVEWKIWNMVKGTEFADLFVPIFACAQDGSWIIMPRVETLNSNGLSITRNELEDKKSLLRDIGIDDLHSGNLTPDGRVLDYGSWCIQDKVCGYVKKYLKRKEMYKELAEHRKA